MKRKLISLILLLLLCGCSTKKTTYDNMKHYDLLNTKKNSFVYINDSGIREVYVLADIPEENSEMMGLFYQVSSNDYILIDELTGGTPLAINHHQIHGNRLYVTANDGMRHIEYTLKREKTTAKDLPFDTSKIIDSTLHLNIIEKVEEKNIYYNVTMPNTDYKDIEKVLPGYNKLV